MNEAFQKDLMECLIKNSDVGFISNIVVFYNNTNIVLPKNNKVKLVVKNGYTDKEIIEYCKRIYNDEIFIFANPFAIFNNSLLNVERNLKNVINSEDYYIFNRNLNFTNNNDNISSIFENTEVNNKISVDRKNIWIKDSSKSKDVKRPLISSKNRVNIERYISKIKRDIKELPKIDIVMVSVNYNDILPITLSSIPKDISVTVVTTSDDIECQRICVENNVKFVISDRIYEEGADFNKGKAINDGIKSIVNPEWILLLDADIYLKDDFVDILKSTNLTPQDLFICKRLIVDNNESFERWKNGEEVGRMERAKGYGFFHLFNIKSVRRSPIFPENYKDASFSDLEFRDSFKSKKELDTYVIHLGTTNQNWNGRKTESFIEEDFNINEYFDKIYCINLDSKKDKWRRVKREFESNSIEVERFSAIDGSLIDEKEFNELLDKYNPYRLSGESASLNGLIENKNSLGCLLSHLEIIKQAKLNNYKRVLIFEDDVILSNDFNVKIKNISKLDWSILYLGASQFNWNKIEEKGDFYLCKNTLGTFAYAIDSSIYDDLINLLETKRKSVDNLLSELQAKNYGRCYTFYTNIVISNVEDSDIRDPKNLIEYSNLVKWELNKFNRGNTHPVKKISIIIPCYEQSSFLEECVNSCLSQTILPNEILILLMDDKSISMKKYLEKKSKIIRCITSDKMYLSAARNKCVNEIESEYFIPLDADDKIPENFIEETSNIDADVVYVGSKYFGAYTGCWPDPITETIDWCKLTTFRRNSLVCTALINKNSFLSSGGYNEDLWAFEDMDMWIRMFKNNFKFEKCFNTFLFYRKHSTTSSLLSKANSVEDNRKSLKKIIMKNDLYSKTPKIIHWVWLGENPIPKDVVDSWFKNLPYGEWNYMMWNEKNFDMNSCDFLKKAYESKKYGICVDYIRAKVLYDYGGVWLDADCVINNDISPFLQYDFFASWENENYINIGLIGCSPKLEQMKNILEYYTNIDVDIDTIKDNLLFVNKIGTGPIVLTKELLKIKNIRNGGFTNEFSHNYNRFLIETPDVFVLDDSNNGRINYAIHLFDGSWTDKKEEWSLVVRRSYEEWKKTNNI